MGHTSLLKRRYRIGLSEIGTEVSEISMEVSEFWLEFYLPLSPCSDVHHNQLFLDLPLPHSATTKGSGSGRLFIREARDLVTFTANNDHKLIAFWIPSFKRTAVRVLRKLGKKCFVCE